eukprot:scaffold1482_cov120-Cylindrotheca_fusiformis.AAC.21
MKPYHMVCRIWLRWTTWSSCTLSLVSAFSASCTTTAPTNAAEGSDDFSQLLLKELMFGNGDGIALPGTKLEPVPPSVAAILKSPFWMTGQKQLEISDVPKDVLSLSGGTPTTVVTVPPELETFLSDTFDAVVASHKLHGNTNVQMNRHDLNHGHLFRPTASNDNTTTPSTLNSTSMLGILFHCAEYPAKDSPILKGIDLGSCQIDSTCRPSLREWRYRNVLWSAWWNNNTPIATTSPMVIEQGIWLLDGKAPEIANLRVDGTDFGPQCPNTVWEGFLGNPVADLFCLGDGKVWCSPILHTLGKQ